MKKEENQEEVLENLNIGIVTISDSRSAAQQQGRDEDESGKIIEQKLKGAGFFSNRTIIPDEEDKIEERVKNLISDPDVDAVITTGGTGITSRDKTVDVIRKIFDKEIPGFGESLRRLGYEKVGVPGILTRTTAGLADKKPIFCLPGAPNATEVGMDLILSDLKQIIKHAHR